MKICLKNVVHGSDSLENGKRELCQWTAAQMAMSLDAQVSD